MGGSLESEWVERIVWCLLRRRDCTSGLRVPTVLLSERRTSVAARGAARVTKENCGWVP